MRTYDMISTICLMISSIAYVLSMVSFSYEKTHALGCILLLVGAVLLFVGTYLPGKKILHNSDEEND